MSKLANQVLYLLNILFPANPHKRVFEEHYVLYRGQKLFFDFYVKELLTLFECQGRQHTEFIKHFHGDASKFKAQKFRDNLKIEYCQKNNLFLVRLYNDEEITESLILAKVDKAFNSKYNYCD